jgi:toxin ParE1/3/4
VIFFVATAEEVTIIRVLHGARDIPAILAPDEGEGGQ